MDGKSRYVVIALVAVSVVAGAVAGDPPDDPEAIVLAAMAQAGEIPDQATALANLAWPVEDIDPAVRARARDMLVNFQAYSMGAIQQVIRTRPEHSADAVAAMIESRALIKGQTPPTYVVALDDALWYGDRDARRLAIDELKRYGGPVAILSIMDAAEEDSDLVIPAIDALGQVGNDRARYWLADLLNGPDDDIRRRAAVALAAIGGKAFAPLRDAMRGDDRALREVAAAAMATTATPEELTDLYDYVSTYPDDDPATIATIRARAAQIEAAIEPPL